MIQLKSNGVDMKDVCVQLRSDDRSVQYDMDAATSEHRESLVIERRPVLIF